MISTVAVKLPSFVVTVITATPSASAVTKPLASTVATVSLSDDQVTSLFVASAGATTALSCRVSVTTNV
nr:hypothetical protein [Alkaliphilus transvaalensis]